jgi:hypothetical protein
VSLLAEVASPFPPGGEHVRIAPEVEPAADEAVFDKVTTFSDENAAAAYEHHAVPETGQIFYEGGFANFHLHPPTEVHFGSEDRAPLLLVGATEDHTVPASLTKAQYKRYERSPAKTDLPRVRGAAASAHGRARLAGGRGRDQQLARRRP